LPKSKPQALNSLLTLINKLVTKNKKRKLMIFKVEPKDSRPYITDGTINLVIILNKIANSKQN